jgi:hypothetical protein
VVYFPEIALLIDDISPRIAPSPSRTLKTLAATRGGVEKINRKERKERALTEAATADTLAQAPQDRPGWIEEVSINWYSFTHCDVSSRFPAKFALFQLTSRKRNKVSMTINLARSILNDIVNFMDDKLVSSIYYYYLCLWA